MDNNFEQRAKQYLFEHLLRLKAIGEKYKLSAADEYQITSAMVAIYDRLSEKE